MASKAAALYEEDFYAWTKEQAAALRAHFRGDNRLDVEHLAEEIEDLGRSELHKAESHVEQIIIHLLKLGFSNLSEPRAHWRYEITAFRVSLGRRMTPSIRRRIKRDLPKLYPRAVRLAVNRMSHIEPDFNERLPTECPYTLAMIEGVEHPFFPDSEDRPGAG